MVKIPKFLRSTVGRFVWSISNALQGGAFRRLESRLSKIESINLELMKEIKTNCEQNGQLLNLIGRMHDHRQRQRLDWYNKKNIINHGSK